MMLKMISNNSWRIVRAKLVGDDFVSAGKNDLFT